MTGKTDHENVEAESGHDADDEAAGQEPSGRGPPDGMFYRLQKYGYRKFPSVIPDPDRAAILRDSRSTDNRDNAETEPPADETIDTKCIWAVELYTPSQISELLHRFEKLGWNRDDPTNPDRSPVDWIQSFRESARGGGWFNLGPLYRHGDRRFFYRGREAPLPEGVDYAVASMYSLTSSVTCVVIGFLLDDEHGRKFEDALRLDRQSIVEPLRGRGYRLPGPSHLKETDIKRIRDNLREMAAGWFRTNLPGVFSAGALAGEFPTCEFTTLRKTAPCPGREDRDPQADRWLEILNIDYDLDAWQAEKLPGLKFVWPLIRDREKQFYAVLTCREDTVSDETLRTYGGGGRTSYTTYIDRHVNGLLSRWGLLGLLAGYERHLNTTRDSATFGSAQRAKVLRQLDRLRGHIAQSVDVAAATTDLKHLSEQKGSFLSEVETFKPCDPKLYRDKDITLGEALRADISERSGWLREMDRSVRDLLIEHGTALSARENIKAQGRMVVLTWAIAVLTIVITVLTAVTTIVSINSGSLSWPW